MSNMGKLTNLQFCPCSLQESEEKKKSMQEICDKDSIYMTWGFPQLLQVILFDFTSW